MSFLKTAARCGFSRSMYIHGFTSLCHWFHSWKGEWACLLRVYEPPCQGLPPLQTDRQKLTWKCFFSETMSQFTLTFYIISYVSRLVPMWILRILIPHWWLQLAKAGADANIPIEHVSFNSCKLLFIIERYTLGKLGTLRWCCVFAVILFVLALWLKSISLCNIY
jgi:hypothetical protein